METNSQNPSSEENAKALSKFGFSSEELLETSEKLNAGKDKRRSREICVCGHSYSRHKKKQTGMRCKPNARFCHCDQFRPVITTTNLNPFIRFSKGNGPSHALSQGINGLMEKGGSFNWIEEAAVCVTCGSNSSLVPTLVSKTGLLVEHDKSMDNRMDVLLCSDCYFKLNKNGRLS